MNTPTQTPLTDAEEYAKHVIAHLYPDHSNGARLVQIALNEWLNRHLATLRRERDELRAELLTTHQMACRVGLERDELAKRQNAASEPRLKAVGSDGLFDGPANDSK